MKWTYDDGGRSDAGYKGDTSDCVCRAISIATGIPYKEVYDLINKFSKDTEKINKRHPKHSSARAGVRNDTTKKLMSDYFLWEWVPVMKIGTGCTMHMRSDELPEGTIIVKLSGHIACVKDGILHDTYDCSRDGTRCVYGYWKKP